MDCPFSETTSMAGAIYFRLLGERDRSDTLAGDDADLQSSARAEARALR